MINTWECRRQWGDLRRILLAFFRITLGRELTTRVKSSFQVQDESFDQISSPSHTKLHYELFFFAQECDSHVGVCNPELLVEWREQEEIGVDVMAKTLVFRKLMAGWALRTSLHLVSLF